MDVVAQKYMPQLLASQRFLLQLKSVFLGYVSADVIFSNVLHRLWPNLAAYPTKAGINVQLNLWLWSGCSSSVDRRKATTASEKSDVLWIGTAAEAL